MSVSIRLGSRPRSAERPQHVGVDLERDDIIFGFYSYIERDFIYFDIDVNPYSNPAVKDSRCSLPFKAGDPQRQVFHEIVDGTGAPSYRAMSLRLPRALVRRSAS